MTAPTREEIIAKALTIPGWYDAARLEKLWALAHWAKQATPYPGQACEMLEVGTWFGRSAYVLGHVADYLTMVDTWLGLPQNPADSRYKEAHAGSIESQTRDYLDGITACPIFLRGRSQDLLPEMSSDYYLLVHIDGDHSHPVVDQDVREGWRLTAPGGILCGDDADETDVWQAVQSLNQPYQVYLGKLWWIQKSKGE